MAKSVLDRFDLSLLALVQRDNQTPARVLADKVGLSESAVLRRLRHLRKSGVIVADISVVRPADLGMPLTVITLVTLGLEGLANLDDFAAMMRKQPEVRQCWYVTGEVDFVLHLQMPDMEGYEAFVKDVLLADKNVRGFRTMVSMREIIGVKTALALPAAFPNAERGKATASRRRGK